mmetsp:Transcript_30610/g.72757  ORF Transcript_30610/g.72757 Transcript_30610/m.72757 type:complete len:273 (-) Transcript_30610:88-906(-)
MQMQLVLALHLDLPDLALEVRHRSSLLLHIRARHENHVQEVGGVLRRDAHHLAVLHQVDVKLEQHPVLRTHEQDAVVLGDPQGRDPLRDSHGRPFLDHPLAPPHHRRDRALHCPSNENLVPVGEEELLHPRRRRVQLARGRRLDQLRDFPVVATRHHPGPRLVVDDARVVHVPRDVLLHPRIPLQRPFVNGAVDAGGGELEVIRGPAHGLDEGRVGDEDAQLLESVGRVDDDVGNVHRREEVSPVGKLHLFAGLDRELLVLPEILDQHVEQP